jgi:NADH-quinone oxidoreductase subunit N
MFLLFILSLLSLAGIPPFIGFFTKFYILLYTIKLKYYILTIFGLWISLISAYYYLRILKLIFLEESNYSFLTFNPIVSDIIYIYSH